VKIGDEYAGLGFDGIIISLSDYKIMAVLEKNGASQVVIPAKAGIDFK